MQKKLKLPLQLNWKRGPDMPVAMSSYVQSVVVQGKLYVGGGFTFGNEHIVMVYNISSGEWATLPPYRTCHFTMAVIKNQLVLVGGKEHGSDYGNKVLGIWEADQRAWTHPYPEMSTSRVRCSVVAYNQWLVVAGSYPCSRPVPVEVLNTESKQWYADPITLTSWSSMKTAVVGDMGYFMGGFAGKEGRPTSNMYRVCIPTLISHITSGGTEVQIWKEIHGPSLRHSVPLSASGSLLAVGGWDENGKAVTAIHLYQPDTGDWVKVGDLPSPRLSCTCAMIADREMLVAGGEDGRKLKAVDLALIS